MLQMNYYKHDLLYKAISFSPKLIKESKNQGQHEEDINIPVENSTLDTQGNNKIDQGTVQHRWQPLWQDCLRLVGQIPRSQMLRVLLHETLECDDRQSAVV